MDYKPVHYTTKPGYVPINDISKMDPRIQLYKPQNPITPKDITKKPITYDTKPPKNIKVKPYGPARQYNSYSEYVPPWSRNKEKAKKEHPPPPPKPKPEKKKDKKPDPEPKNAKPKSEPAVKEEAVSPKKVGVTFDPVDVTPERPSLPATGSMLRMLMLFGNEALTAE